VIRRLAPTRRRAACAAPQTRFWHRLVPPDRARHRFQRRVPVPPPRARTPAPGLFLTRRPWPCGGTADGTPRCGRPRFCSRSCCWQRAVRGLGGRSARGSRQPPALAPDRGRGCSWRARPAPRAPCPRPRPRRARPLVPTHPRAHRHRRGRALAPPRGTAAGIRPRGGCGPRPRSPEGCGGGRRRAAGGIRPLHDAPGHGHSRGHHRCAHGRRQGQDSDQGPAEDVALAPPAR
jgi:hypothetical protein